MLSGILMSPASAATFPQLPSTQITVNLTPLTLYAYPFAVTLSNIPTIGGPYDVSGGTSYTGWCCDLVGFAVRGNDYTALLYSSLSITLPAQFASIRWDMINYILNHKIADGTDISQAIWYFVKGGSWPNTWDLPGYPYPLPPSANAQLMVNDALAPGHGSGFVPGPGQVVAVIVDAVDAGKQDIIIELTIPGTGGGGLTPGFWKNNAINWDHCKWVGYTPSETLQTAGFTGATKVNLATTNLLTALQFKGGKNLAGAEQILLRAAVAALLNAGNSQIGYPLTTPEILSQVNTALTSGNRDTMLGLASTIDSYNNLGFSLAMNNKF